MASRGRNRAQAITVSDVTVYSPPLEAIYVGGAGNVTVITSGGDTVTFTAPPVGSKIEGSFSKVKAATTATLLIGQWSGHGDY